MLFRRIQSENLAIQRMGKPGQRVPVGLLKRGERPSDSAPVNARAHLRIFDDIAIVVVAQEFGAEHAVVKRQGTQRQQQAKNQAALAPGAQADRHIIIESGFKRQDSWI